MKSRAKSSAIVLAVLAAGFVGIAAAGETCQNAQAVPISATVLAPCVPPNAAPGDTCDAFNQAIRANFTLREIGMLFGYSTSYAASKSGGLESLNRRYQEVVQQFLAAHPGGGGASGTAQ